MPETLSKQAEASGLVELRVWRASPQEPHARSASREWLMEHVPGASAIMCIPATKVDEELMDAAGPSLKVVSTMSVGFEHIDRAAAKKRGIRVGYTPDVLSNAVADLSLVLALNMMRNTMEGYHVVKNGMWSKCPWTPVSFCGPALEGKSVGFLGLGSISQALVGKLLPFKPKEIVYKVSQPREFDLKDPHFRFLANNDLFQAYTQCYHRLPFPMVNEHDITAFAQRCDVILTTAYLINVGRGGLVDTDALVQALHAKEIAGAGLDVLEGEPHIAAEHPLLAPELVNNVMILPHIASATQEAREEYTCRPRSSSRRSF
ncbi:hypothetical protein MCAP1_002534 [Malassezia caprae]|uniref:Glyoxylate reductase n=1 Tax=Malassezia caprae TaxID=1381934 RepID=A0AAF0J0R8_9BASI|nr:hypothetical protein MCAP1_002534 [Malassezia caprae]